MAGTTCGRMVLARRSVAPDRTQRKAPCVDLPLVARSPGKDRRRRSLSPSHGTLPCSDDLGASEGEVQGNSEQVETIPGLSFGLWAHIRKRQLRLQAGSKSAGWHPGPGVRPQEKLKPNWQERFLIPPPRAPRLDVGCLQWCRIREMLHERGGHGLIWLHAYGCRRCTRHNFLDWG